MSRTKGRPWTADDLSLLRKLARWSPLSTIAAQMDRTPLAIRTKAAHERLRLLDDVKDAAPGRRDRVQ